LREAHAQFSRAPADVACLQAPLVIGNGGDSWLSAMFALEYAALFRALLPLLAKYRMPLPLGGTSNHFRTDILRAVGAWDPFNVTEDADLGMRLYRLGYRSDVIERQTIEDAPNDVGVWSRQRTRWFKGWLQTWLVMMRNPAELRREMGTTAFCVFHLLIGGMLLSSLAHPLILAFFTHSLVLMLSPPAEALPVCRWLLFGVDFANVLGSYAIFLLLGTAAMIDHEKRRIGWRWMAVPLYWMLVSAAAWRAVVELRTNPFFWHKTPHKPSSPGHD
jgi:cellulose synthase/poly-beta-1,6-N-acetylglucosamine synthase-like glycosyltransferase